MAYEDEMVIVERAKAGDRAALEAMLARVAPSIHRFGMRMCRNASDADDVLQDALVAMTEHIGELQSPRALSSWAFTLARTACARKRRGLKNKPPASDSALERRAADELDPEGIAAAHELGSEISRALESLSDEHREVVVMRDVEGLSAKETADVLGMSVDAVKSRLHRARVVLRDALAPLREAPEPSCPDVAAMWSNKLEGDLSSGDCAAMEAHLASCPKCEAACESLRAALGACARARDVSVPDAIQTRVREAIEQWARRHPQ